MTHPGVGTEGGTSGSRDGMSHNRCVCGHGDVPQVQATPMNTGDQVVVPGTPAGIYVPSWTRGSLHK